MIKSTQLVTPDLSKTNIKSQLEHHTTHRLKDMVWDTRDDADTPDSIRLMGILGRILNRHLLWRPFHLIHKHEDTKSAGEIPRKAICEILLAGGYDSNFRMIGPSHLLDLFCHWIQLVSPHTASALLRTQPQGFDDTKDWFWWQK